MAIGIIARLTVQQGKNAEFETVFGELAAAVRANETGNNFYALHQSREDANLYVVMEQYRDEDAVAAHRASDHFRTIGAKLGPLLAAPPDIQTFDSIV